MKPLAKILPITALLLAVSSSAAYAGDKKDLKRLEAAKLTLTEAIAIAEKAQEGKAIDAELDGTRDGKVVYDVTVVKGKRFYEVRVDAVDGNVLRTVEDK